MLYQVIAPAVTCFVNNLLGPIGYLNDDRFENGRSVNSPLGKTE